jgi:2-polyprenyl-3-methyl-5-hydroxy-6-metoxy-1,4-benzoquinol methylase
MAGVAYGLTTRREVWGMHKIPPVAHPQQLSASWRTSRSKRHDRYPTSFAIDCKGMSMFTSNRFDGVGTWLEAMGSIKPYLQLGDETLDFGCGAGGSTKCFAKITGCEHITGVDVDRPNLERARQFHPRIAFRSYGWLLNNSVLFDRIVSMHGLPLVRDIDECLDTLKQRLQPHGRMIFTVPGCGFHTLHWQSLEQFSHVWTLRALRKLLAKHYLEVVTTEGFGDKALCYSEHYLIEVKHAGG